MYREVRVTLPTANGWPRPLTVRIGVAGAIDQTTGFVCDVRALDQRIRDRLETDPWSMPLGTFVTDLWQRLVDAKPSPTNAEPTLAELELVLPHGDKLAMTMDAPGQLLLTTRFHFCAAHRLYNRALSPDENAQIFGPCGHPSGHGHNYTLDVTISGPADENGHAFPPRELRRLVEQVLIHFDHRNLNNDVPEFATINPTVENVSAVLWRLLDEAIPNQHLHAIRLYETEKIWADYRRPPPRSVPASIKSAEGH
jgi:6-pyruvoyltetrahydropterin/6-carboxytetrahydropterin synthase